MRSALTRKKVFRSISALARDWGVSPLTVRRMVKAGQLRTVKLNRRSVIHIREVERVERGE
jgi:hypothetical protein